MSCPSTGWINNTITKIIHYLYQDITKHTDLPLVLVTNVTLQNYNTHIIAETSKLKGKNAIRIYYENLFKYIGGKDYSYDVKYPHIRFKLLVVMVHEMFHIASNIENNNVTIDELEDRINFKTIDYINNNKNEIEKWYGHFNPPRNFIKQLKINYKRCTFIKVHLFYFLVK